MPKILIMLFAFLFAFAAKLSAAAPTSFTEALPTSLIPDGFWSLAGLALALVIAIAGVGVAIKMIRKAS